MNAALELLAVPAPAATSVAGPCRPTPEEAQEGADFTNALNAALSEPLPSETARVVPEVATTTTPASEQGSADGSGETTIAALFAASLLVRLPQPPLEPAATATPQQPTANTLPAASLPVVASSASAPASGEIAVPTVAVAVPTPATTLALANEKGRTAEQRASPPPPAAPAVEHTPSRPFAPEANLPATPTANDTPRPKLSPPSEPPLPLDHPEDNPLPARPELLAAPRAVTDQTPAISTPQPATIQAPASVVPATASQSWTEPALTPIGEPAETSEPHRETETEPGFAGVARLVATPPRTAEAEAPPAPAPGPQASQSIAEQVADGVVRNARLIEREGTTEITLELHPRELGKVHVQLRMTREGLTAQLTVGDEAVRQVVEGQLHLLRQRLTEAALPVVNCSLADSGGQMHQGGQQQAWRSPFATTTGGPPQRLFTGPSAPRAQGRGLDVMA